MKCTCYIVSCLALRSSRLRRKKLATSFKFSSCCHVAVSVLFLFLLAPCVSLQCVIVALIILYRGYQNCLKYALLGRNVIRIIVYFELLDLKILSVYCNLQKSSMLYWASTRQNLPTKRHSNQSPQLQRLAIKLKFYL